MVPLWRPARRSWGADMSAYAAAWLSFLLTLLGLLAVPLIINICMKINLRLSATRNAQAPTEREEPIHGS